MGMAELAECSSTLTRRRDGRRSTSLPVTVTGQSKSLRRPADATGVPLTHPARELSERHDTLRCPVGCG